MRLLERPIEFLLLQSEIPTDHNGATTREISEKKTKNRILSFVYISNNRTNHIIYRMCNILQRDVCRKKLDESKLSRYTI